MVEIKLYSEAHECAWDEYVMNHSGSNLYHLSGWKTVIERTYGHKTYYLVAYKAGNRKQEIENGEQGDNSEDGGGDDLLKSKPGDSEQNNAKLTEVCGVLPLVHLKHFIFGNNLVSMPYFDMGGVLADDVETEQALLTEAVTLGQDLNVDTIELRHCKPITSLSAFDAMYEPNPTNPQKNIRLRVRDASPRQASGQSSTNSTNSTNSSNSLSFVTHSHKVRMVLELPESSEVLLKSFKSKLRSQIKKPEKEGLKSKNGGLELLDDFYTVFAVNMRDLGSPVHAKGIMQNVLTVFHDQSKIVVVYKESTPVASSLVVGFRDILENPWASALRQYSRLSPNMLLYWTMLEYACDNGYRFFDFGRSTPDEGTYKFKKQWGAEPKALNWQYIFLKDDLNASLPTDKSKFEKAMAYWKKLPVAATKVIGPRIRKHIGL